MAKFWDLFKSSVVLQFTLAVMFSGTICALYLMGREVPGDLMQALMLILGVVFGQKVQQLVSQNRANRG